MAVITSKSRHTKGMSTQKPDAEFVTIDTAEGRIAAIRISERLLARLQSRPLLDPMSAERVARINESSNTPGA